MGIGLSNYVASGLCQRTAFVDLEKEGQQGLWNKDKPRILTIKEVVYYSGFVQEDIPLLVNQDYRCIIFDFGCEYVRYRREFMRCDTKIAVLNLSAWQEDSSNIMAQTLREEEWGKIHPKYVSTFFDAEVKERFEQRTEERVLEIPVFHHPFCIKKEQFDLMGELLSEAVPNKKARKLHIPGSKKH